MRSRGSGNLAHCLLTSTDFGEGLSIANYDITHDGRFIMLRRIADSGNLRVVVNWKDELIRLLGAGGTK